MNQRKFYHLISASGFSLTHLFQISPTLRWPVSPASLFFRIIELILYRRFTDHELPYEDLRTNLTMLMQSYLSTMIDLGAETWIMHGTLMGWWWNRKVSPESLDLFRHWTDDL